MKLLKKCTTVLLAVIISTQTIPVFASSNTGQSGTTARVNTNGVSNLTINQATSRAIDNSSSIRNIQDNITTSREQEQRLREDLFTSNHNMAAFLSASASLMQSELNRALQLDNIKAQRDNINYIISNQFANIIAAEKALEIHNERLAVEEKELEILKVKVDLGIASQSSYNQANLNYNRSLNTRDSLVNSINEAYRELNRVMGEPLDRKYNLIFDLEYETMGDINLTAYIDNHRRNSIRVAENRNSVNVAQYQLDNHTLPYDPQTGEVFPGGGTSRDERIASLNIAARNLEDTRKEVENNVVSTYNRINNLEIEIQSSLIQLETLQNELEILNTRLRLGQITQLEVDKHMLNIIDLEERIRQQKANHTLLVMQFQNPNILT